MPKLFVASFLDEAEANRLGAIIHKRAEEISSSKKVNIRATPREKLHLTWIYLGEVLTENIDAVAAQVRQSRGILKAQPPVALAYEKLELWPQADKTRVAVLTPDAAPAEILEIATVLKTNLEKFVHARTEKFETFIPHLTIFRMNSPQSLTKEYLLNDKSLLPVRQKIEINSIHLVLSGESPPAARALSTERRGSYTIIPT